MRTSEEIIKVLKCRITECRNEIDNWRNEELQAHGDKGYYEYCHHIIAHERTKMEELKLLLKYVEGDK
jgi:hypothetical protein